MIEIDLPVDYIPSESEEYMSPFQLEYFRRKLLVLKDALIKSSAQKTLVILEKKVDSDETDMASWEQEASVELKTSDRYRKLIKEVDDALERIANFSYGYCQETGDEIGLARLEVNPVTLYCIEEQEKREKERKVYNLSDDE